MDRETRRCRQRGRREWGYVRKQGTKSGRYQASYIGPDLRRHFAPVTFSSKMNAESWLAKEKDLIEKATYNEDYVWQPPETRKLEKKAAALTLAEYSAVWIEQRKLKPRTRIGYQASLKNHIAPKLGRIAIRDLNPPVDPVVGFLSRHCEPDAKRTCLRVTARDLCCRRERWAFAS